MAPGNAAGFVPRASSKGVNFSPRDNGTACFGLGRARAFAVVDAHRHKREPVKNTRWIPP